MDESQLVEILICCNDNHGEFVGHTSGITIDRPGEPWSFEEPDIDVAIRWCGPNERRHGELDAPFLLKFCGMGYLPVWRCERSLGRWDKIWVSVPMTVWLINRLAVFNWWMTRGPKDVRDTFSACYDGIEITAEIFD